MVAQLLFVSSRARRNIQTTIYFLTSRVRKPDEDDWGKFLRCMKYLKGTKYTKLTLTVDTMSVIKWWVDLYHHTHMYCRGNIAAMISLGNMAAVSYSGKHKLNTKILTESELIRADDMLVKVLWGLYFIQAQGYSADQNIMYQDNMETMHLEINGSLSSSKHTRHIKAGYFSIKDKVDTGEIVIEHCPTEMMWADVLNNPKVVRPFRLDCSYIMNVPVDYDNNTELLKTHPDLLPEEYLILANLQHMHTSVHHRSVLGDNVIIDSQSA